MISATQPRPWVDFAGRSDSAGFAEMRNGVLGIPNNLQDRVWGMR